MVPRSYLDIGGVVTWHFSISTMYFLCFAGKLMFAHRFLRKAAIMLRTSTSLNLVSSNPGVSIKTTRRPSRSKGFPNCTSFVQDSRLPLVARSDPLVRLMNCVNREA